MSSNGTLKCVECNADIKLHYNYCPVCGSEVDELQKNDRFLFLARFQIQIYSTFYQEVFGCFNEHANIKNPIKIFWAQKKKSEC